MVPIRVAGTGYHVPDKVLTNFDLEKSLDTSDEWIVRRTGISERRLAAPEEAASDLALPAVKDAIKAAGITERDLDYIIFATVTPDMCCPSAANFLQAKLDAPQAAAFDVTAACSGFVFALDVACMYLKAGKAKNILVVASEVMTRVQDWTDRSNCILWGDGAGAAILTAGDERAPQLKTTYIGSDGANGQNLLMPGGGSLTTPISYESVDAKKHTLNLIEANHTMKVAVKYFELSVRTVLDEYGLTPQDVDVYVPHQANIRMIQVLAKRLNVDMDKFFMTIHKYGNISSASCAITLAEAVATGHIKKGDVVCLTVFGGGLTWGGGLIQF